VRTVGQPTVNREMIIGTSYVHRLVAERINAVRKARPR